MSSYKGSGRCCAVFGCANSQRKLNIWKGETCAEHGLTHENCVCSPPYMLHRFPHDPKARRKWCAALRRKAFKPSQSSVVCSLHFVEKPNKGNPCPQLNLGYQQSSKEPFQYRNSRKRDVLAPCVSNSMTPAETESIRHPAVKVHVQGKFQDILNNTNSVVKVTSANKENVILVKEILDNISGEDDVSDEVVTTEQNCKPCSQKNSCTQFISTMPQSETSNLLSVLMDHNYASVEKLKDTAVQTEQFLLEFSSDKEFQFFTSMSRARIRSLVSVLMPESPPVYGLTPEHCVILVLMRLRLGLLFEDLGFRFKVNKGTANRIFTVWIKHMSRSLRECIAWLPRETIQMTMPECFKNGYERTTCIIDCTELFIQRSFNFCNRAITYSDYKSHNTVKYLVAIAPNGLIMFISKGYGGRASDKHISLDSGIFQYLLPNDKVMADRGFTISEELMSYHVDLNMPSFTKGRNQLPEIEVVTSRRIASVRIHVERVIGRLKNFRLLLTVLPLTSMAVIDDILVVSSALCNINKRII